MPGPRRDRPARSDRRRGRARRRRGPARGRARSPRPRRPRRRAATSIGVPAGVWRTALVTRLAIAWRRWSLSPSTTTGSGASSVTGGPGAAATASLHASAASTARSTARRSTARVSSRRARSSRSSTRIFIRADSSSMRRMIDGQVDVVVGRRRGGTTRRSPGSTSAGCAARARRRRGTGAAGRSVASRSGKAVSISSSIVLRARPSWPTSLRPSAGVDPRATGRRP